MKFYIKIEGSQTLQIGTPPKVKHLLIRGLKSVCLKFKNGKLVIQKFQNQSILHHHYYLTQDIIKGKLLTKKPGLGLICLVKGGYTIFEKRQVYENQCQLCYFPENTPLFFKTKEDMRVLIFQFSLDEVKQLKQYHPNFSKYITAYQTKSRNLILSKPYQIDINIRLQIKEILKCNIDDKVLKRLILDSHTNRVFITIMRILRDMHFNALEENTDRSLYLEIKSYISLNLSSDLNIRNLAAIFYTNETRIRHVFRKYEGITLGNFCIEIRFEKAKQLLTTTTISIEEIANWIGYQSANNFSTAFKKKYKLTPSHYRIKYTLKQE